MRVDLLAVMLLLLSPASLPAAEDLIAIAEREAAREKAAYEKDVKNVIAELGIADNPQLAYVSERLAQLVKIGPAAVPHLLEAIKNAGSDSDGTRRANNAARALGTILKASPDPATAAELRKLASDGSNTSKAAAIRAIGLVGDASAMPMLEVALTGSQLDLAAAAAIAIGNLGLQEGGELLVRALARPEADLRRVVVRSLTQLEFAPALNPLLDMLSTSELGDTRFNIVQLAAKIGNVDAIDKLAKFLDTPAPGDLRESAIDAIAEIGKRGKSTEKSKAITVLSKSLESPASNLAERAALALHQLGDDRGLDIVIEEESRILRTNPKHFAARVARARKYYQFQRYSEAIKDCRQALDAQRGQSLGSVNVLLAACFAGLEDYKTAKRHLDKSEAESLKQLAETYPELAAMAKDPKYSKLFEK